LILWLTSNKVDFFSGLAVINALLGCGCWDAPTTVDADEWIHKNPLSVG
jgi:hypothetical protein